MRIAFIYDAVYRVKGFTRLVKVIFEEYPVKWRKLFMKERYKQVVGNEGA